MLRVVLIGCGDIAQRTAALLRDRVLLHGVTRRKDATDKLRASGIVPVVADLDDFRSLARLAGAPFAVLHFAPPDGVGHDDSRTRRLLAFFARAGNVPRRFVYISTSGVYGDCGGARIDETRPRTASTARGKRRVVAEDRIRRWATRHGVAATILRVPGIYADTRLPTERIRSATPVLAPEHDVYTNHIHADDLARAVVAAMFRGATNRAYHVSDDAEMTASSWFDAVADAFALPRPPRVSRAEARTSLTPVSRSFLSESRRLVNARMKRELRVALRYPTPQTLLQRIARRDSRRQLPLAL
ncbi:MAG TPA: NAD-dependent epimerase/dehydratase family protein [Casimicrobiaceae bacterium]|nr:NAD-dependent epimerase/dehydratase family protein [Casimicrobiaceae bacterium]